MVITLTIFFLNFQLMNFTEDNVVMNLGTLRFVVAGTPVDQQNSTNAAVIANALRATAFLVNGSQLSTEEVEQVKILLYNILMHFWYIAPIFSVLGSDRGC